MGLPSWIRTDECEPKREYGSCRTYKEIDEIERFVVDRRAKATTLCESRDPHADYSFNNFALIEIDNYYFVFGTTGCSCPSPDEVWGFVMMGTREELAPEISSKLENASSSSGWISFQQEVAKIWPEVIPGDMGKRYDW